MPQDEENADNKALLDSFNCLRAMCNEVLILRSIICVLLRLKFFVFLFLDDLHLMVFVRNYIDTYSVMSVNVCISLLCIFNESTWIFNNHFHYSKYHTRESPSMLQGIYSM